MYKLYITTSIESDSSCPNCSAAVQSTEHILFHFLAYTRLRQELLHSNKINSKDLIKLSVCNLADELSGFVSK